MTITLGDEFQGVIDSTENAIKVIFEIEEEIINNNQDLKLRYVINKGKIDTPINKNIAYEMLKLALGLPEEAQISLTDDLEELAQNHEGPTLVDQSGAAAPPACLVF